MNTNVSAMTAQRNLSVSSMRSSSSLGKLSSGSRVPTAKDDAAALSIGTGLKRDVAALKSAQVNAQQGTSMLQVADGAFGQIGDILIRMKTLASSALSEQISDTERGFLNTEFGALRDEIDRIAATTVFNGVELLGGSSTIDLNVQGANIAAVDGMVGFSFDSAVVGNGDRFEVSYELATNSLSIAKLIGGAAGGAAAVTQTLTVAAPATGSTATYNFDDLGVEIVLNDQFGAAGTAFVADFNLDFASTATADQFTAVTGNTAAAADLDFHVGVDASTGVAGDVNVINVQIDLGNFLQLSAATNGGVFTGVGNLADARTATDDVDSAVAAVNSARAELGSTMNRLGFAEASLAVAIENTEAARSTMMDVDVSAEMTTFTSQQVLIQAGVSMLAQANQQPSLLLRLLQ